jgi:hypothetical protein
LSKKSVDGRILGLSFQAGSNRVDSNTIDLPVNNFAPSCCVDPIFAPILSANGDAIARTLPMTIGHAKFNQS